MSAPNNPSWPFVSSDKRPLFFNPQPRTQTTPKRSEPWVYSDIQSRKRRHSEVEEEPTDNQNTTGTRDASKPNEQGEPARKVHITPRYRVSRNQERFRISDVGEYVCQWALRRFSTWMAQGATSSDTSDEHVHRESRGPSKNEWEKVMQDVDGEVTAFKKRKQQWKESGQNHSNGKVDEDEDVEMIDASEETESLEEELLILRSRYNFLGERALARRFDVNVAFFTEEELTRPDLPSSRNTRQPVSAHQTTVRDENEGVTLESGVTRGQLPVMPGAYQPSPPRPTLRHDTLPTVIDSRYGLIVVPVQSGYSGIKDTMNEPTDSSSESDSSATEDSDDSASEESDSSSEHDDSDARTAFKSSSHPTSNILPAHLIPAHVPRALAHPIHKLGTTAPMRKSTGTADVFDQRRALLLKSGLKQLPLSEAVTKGNLDTQRVPPSNPTSSIQFELTSDDDDSMPETLLTFDHTIQGAKASSPPAIPQITVEPPSDSSQSSSMSPPDLGKPLPRRPVVKRKLRGGEKVGQEPKKLTSLRGSVGPAKPLASALLNATGGAVTTGQKPQETLGTANSTGSTKPLSSASSKTTSSSSVTGRKARKASLNENPTGPGKSLFSAPNISTSGASRTVQKPGFRSGIPGLGNSILGKKKATSGHSNRLQAQSGFGKPTNTTNGSGDENISGTPGTSRQHAPGNSIHSGKDEGDEDMKESTPLYSPNPDEQIVTYHTSHAFTHASPNHFMTGGAGPAGTLEPLGNPITVPRHEAERLATERENTPRGRPGAPYFNETFELSEAEQQEYAAIQAYEKHKVQKLQIKRELKDAEEAQAKHGSEFRKTLGSQ